MNKIISVFIGLAISFLAFGSSFAGNTINGAGATFPYPVYSAWAYEYNKVSGVKLNYQSIGSGGGIRQIVNKTVDFGASDAPLKPEELKKNNLIQFPAVIGGVVPVVNIRGIKAGELRLDSDILSMIYLGEINYWDNEKIKQINPGKALPHKEITVVHRSDGSGTTAIFTDYLSVISSDWKEKVGAGTSVKWPVGIGGKGNEGVANYVKRLDCSIGYVEFAYAKQNSLAHTILKNSTGQFVEPSFNSFKAAADSGDFDPKKDFYLWLNNAPGKKAWPIAGATFILLAKEKKESNINVVKFYEWAFEKGDKTAEELVYIPLPVSLKNKVRAYWKSYNIY